jgi:hypothetical protein
MTEDRSALHGYVVSCDQCHDPEILVSRFYDVAERYAEVHADTTGHTPEVVESP